VRSRRSVRVRAARERDDALLPDQPPQYHLRHGFTVRDRDLTQKRLVEDAADGHAAIGGHGNPLPPAGLDERGLVEIGMVLELVGYDRRGRELDRFGHQSSVEIADADMPDLTGFDRGIQSLDLLGERNRFARSMQEQEIDVIGSEFLEALIDGARESLLRIIGDPDLGREEKLFTRESGCGDVFADLGFIAVDLRGIDVTEAGLEGRRDGAQDVRSRHTVGSKPQSRAAGHGGHRDFLLSDDHRRRPSAINRRRMFRISSSPALRALWEVWTE
jgi:hypothetical protein